MAPLFLFRFAKVECLTQDQEPCFTSHVPQPPHPSVYKVGTNTTPVVQIEDAHPWVKVEGAANLEVLRQAE